MSKRKPGRKKKVPQRTCVGCRTVLPKRELIRIVRTPEGVRVDPTGKAAGRGAYLHRKRSCWEQGLKGALARALKTEIHSADEAALRAFLLTLPEDEESA